MCIRDRKEEYRKQVDSVLAFLKGQTKELTDTLTEKMMAESEAMNFEKAAEYRDRLRAVSYTHLDVYKSQEVLPADVFLIRISIHR